VKLLLAAAGLLLAAQEERKISDWPTYHGNTALDGLADTSLPDEPVRLWEFKTGAPVEVPPVAADGRIFAVTAKGSIFALDAGGREVWSGKLKDDFFSSPPLHAEKTVFAGTGNGWLIAYDAAGGREKWKYKVGDMVMGSANVVDLPGGRKAVIVISQTDGVLHAVDLETGKAVWSLDKIDRCDGSPSAGSGRIVWGSCASALHVIVVEKEPKRRDVPLGDDGQVAGGVALSGKMAYAGTYGGKLFAVDVEAARIVWKSGFSASEAFTTPAVNDRLVVYGSLDGKVYALNRRTGEKVWEHDTGDSPSSPLIARDRLALSSGGSLLLLDLATGRKVWGARVSDMITGPAAAGGRLIVGTDSGTVAAFGRK